MGRSDVLLLGQPQAYIDPLNAWDRGLSWYEDNTGVPDGTVLTPSAGFSASTAGATYEGLDISGQVSIRAANVTLRNCRINRSQVAGSMGVRVYSGSVTLDHCEIVGTDAQGIGWGLWTLTNCYIHGFINDGVKLGDDCSLIDCLINDPVGVEGGHEDGAQMQTGAQNVLVRRSWIDMTGISATSAIIMKIDLPTPCPATANNIVVEHNYLAGGSYSLYAIHMQSLCEGAAFGDLTVTGNTFGDHTYGYYSVNVLGQIGVDCDFYWADNRTTAGVLIAGPE